MNNQQTLIIYKFDELFNILNEAKSYLNFEIKAVNSNKIDNIFTKNNCLIISNKKLDNFENQVIIKQYPINIIKLFEIININFLKLKFNEQNKIQIGNYYLNLNSKILSDKKENLNLTEKEAKIIFFLNKSLKPITITSLQKEVWGHRSQLDTHTVETHIYRLRKKIEKKFYDKKFISSLKGGYKINA